MLFDADANPFANLEARLQQARGSEQDIILGGDRCCLRFVNAAISRQFELEPVAQIDKLKHGLQQVIAIGAPPGDVQHEVELGRRRQSQ